jgi:hypothetical protein
VRPPVTRRILAVGVCSIVLGASCEEPFERVTYGDWCGPFHSGAADDPGIDSLDAQCRTHDLCYDAVPVAADDYYECASGAKVECDGALVSDLTDLGDEPDRWPVPPAPGNRETAISYRSYALEIFGDCIDIFD